MHLRRTSELFIDEPLKLPDILVVGQGPDCALTAANGDRTVASLVTRHLAAVLEQRCRSALEPCLEHADLPPRTTLLRLERVGATAARAFRVTAWVDRLDDGGVAFTARADDGEGGGCDATVAFAVGKVVAWSRADVPPALAA